MLVDLVAYYWFSVKLVLIFTATLIFISSLDDLFIDIYFWIRTAYRALFVRRRYPPLLVSRLYESPQQLIAIMVPAWQEQNVIARMLLHSLSTFNYNNFHIFIGTYPNDAGTQLEVDRVALTYPNVHKVTCATDGPTSKADCLNNVVAGILRYEREQNIEFAIFVLHDAEDVNHPLELRLFNHLIPRKDLVQLPVLPLEREWNQFTSGHYLDEFAEYHTKDLVVRESLAGAVPSAGVGTGFSRRAILTLYQEGGGQVFSLKSLTEDYDISYQLKKYGMAEIFVRFAVEVPYSKRTIFGEQRGRRKEYVAVREYFPDRLRAAVKQKGRWIFGIVFQGWANIQWPGDLAMKYMLVRDRKSVLTTQINMLGYFIVVNIFGMFLYQSITRQPYQYPPLIGEERWLLWVVFACGLFLLNRTMHRMVFVYWLYGWKDALLSAPRQVWGNIVNFLASCRATGMFVKQLVRKEKLVWDKTQHAFPTEQQLQPFRRRLGELLLESGAIDTNQLEKALDTQRRDRRALGQILLDAGLLSAEKLKEALARQARTHRPGD